MSFQSSFFSTQKKIFFLKNVGSQTVTTEKNKKKTTEIYLISFHLRNKVIQFRNTWRWVNDELWLNYTFNNAHNNVKPNHWRIWEATVSLIFVRLDLRQEFFLPTQTSPADCQQHLSMRRLKSGEWTCWIVQKNWAETSRTLMFPFKDLAESPHWTV